MKHLKYLLTGSLVLGGMILAPAAMILAAVYEPALLFGALFLAVAYFMGYMIVENK
jgi:hypothetical protein